MQRKTLLFLLFFTLLSSTISAQLSGAMYLFGYPRFAKAIRLGDVYTGIAEGPEALFYNPAGIVNQNHYSVIVSKGMGAALFIDDYNSMDYAIIAPLPKNYGSIGISINTFKLEFSGVDNFDMVYSVHYARNLTKFFSVSISGNLYSTKMTNVDFYEPDGSYTTKTISAKAFDFSLSMLYSLPRKFKLMKNDDFKLGFQFKNILGSTLHYNETPQLSFEREEPVLFQNMRAGFSYKLIPKLKPIGGFYPVNLLFAFDAVFKGADYDFGLWQPNYGIELSLLEILKLSFGRGNEIKIKDEYSSSPQHPVNRFGIGVTIPFNKIFKLKQIINLEINYAKSDWQKIDESNGRTIYNLPFSNEIDDNAFSAELRMIF